MFESQNGQKIPLMELRKIVFFLRLAETKAKIIKMGCDRVLNKS